ncbi:hypothetical protein ABH926_005607 [Catenulispora sp. GP43]|uniref:hypothetical protein n=1 Tax=Catenulispora sp. GP43 TaxID=3156263 RepID=UPI003512400A
MACRRSARARAICASAAADSTPSSAATSHSRRTLTAVTPTSAAMRGASWSFSAGVKSPSGEDVAGTHASKAASWAANRGSRPAGKPAGSGAAETAACVSRMSGRAVTEASTRTGASSPSCSQKRSAGSTGW